MQNVDFVPYREHNERRKWVPTRTNRCWKVSFFHKTCITSTRTRQYQFGSCNYFACSAIHSQKCATNRTRINMNEMVFRMLSNVWGVFGTKCSNKISKWENTRSDAPVYAVVAWKILEVWLQKSKACVFISSQMTFDLVIRLNADWPAVFVLYPCWTSCWLGSRWCAEGLEKPRYQHGGNSRASDQIPLLSGWPLLNSLSISLRSAKTRFSFKFSVQATKNVASFIWNLSKTSGEWHLNRVL